MAAENNDMLAARIQELEQQLVDMKQEHAVEVELLQDQKEVLEMELEQARNDAQYHLYNQGVSQNHLVQAQHIIHELEMQLEVVLNDNQQLLQAQAAFHPPPAVAAQPAEIQGNSGMDYEDLPTPDHVSSDSGSSVPQPPAPAVLNELGDENLANALRETLKKFGLRVTSIYPTVD